MIMVNHAFAVLIINVFRKEKAVTSITLYRNSYGFSADTLMQHKTTDHPTIALGLLQRSLGTLGYIACQSRA